MESSGIRAADYKMLERISRSGVKVPSNKPVTLTVASSKADLLALSFLIRPDPGVLRKGRKRRTKPPKLLSTRFFLIGFSSKLLARTKPWPPDQLFPDAFARRHPAEKRKAQDESAQAALDQVFSCSVPGQSCSLEANSCSRERGDVRDHVVATSAASHAQCRATAPLEVVRYLYPRGAET